MKKFSILCIALLSMLFSFGQTVDSTKSLDIGTTDTLLTILTTTLQTFTYPQTVVRVVRIPKSGGANQSPIVNPGSAQTITLPVNSVTLSATATDKDGTISSSVWSSTSAANIVTPNALSTLVTFTTSGSYTFKFTATDDKGTSSSGNVTVTVNSQPTNPPPTSGLTGYGTITSIVDFESVLSSDQLGRGFRDSVIKLYGKYSFHAWVKKGDASISSGWRSEQNLPSPASEGGIEFDYYVINYTNFSLFFQCHGNTSGTSGPFADWMNNGTTMMEQSDENHNNTYQTSNLQKVVLNKWVHVRIEWKLAASGGYLHTYQDGVLVYNANNVKTNDNAGQYLKIGINLFRPDNGQTAPGDEEICYDNVILFKK